MIIEQRINKNAINLAIVSFLIGTVLLISYIVTNHSALALFGFFYVLIMTVLNTIAFIGLLGNCLLKPEYGTENMKSILILLANIPITLIYTYIVLRIDLLI